ncbi:IclR family transcriptional regulator [Streptomyces sp. NPDC090106]|uniref:IclR family transcriptional regulator n=1 Tax=Streptomyces sp. NPDC090106 TaxID=3365946 RepID=UPI0037F3CA3F
MAGNQATPGRTVASKVVQVLAAFSGDHDELSLTQLQRLTGLPTSTAHRLAQDLLGEGILERSPQGNYRIGLRLWEIASRSVRGSGLREIAMPYLQSLYEMTQQHVQLALLDGDQALVVEKISRLRGAPTRSRAGGRLPLHASGVGRAMLAHTPEAVQERILRSPLAPYTAHTVTSPRELRFLLAQIRRDRTAYCHQEFTVGAFACAAPIPAPEASTVAAISVIVRTDQEAVQFAAAVRTTAVGIRRALQARYSTAPQIGRPSSGTVPAQDHMTAGTIDDGRQHPS